MSYELAGYGLGSVRAWENYQTARRMYPGATGYSMSYRNGRLTKITPRYNRASSAARQQHESLDRRLAEVRAQEEERLSRRLREIQRSL